MQTCDDMRVLTVTIKRHWFHKIIAGEKVVEYREEKPYWTVRLSKKPTHILFRAGYSRTAPKAIAAISKVVIQNGSFTDLKVKVSVYAIHFFDVKELV